METASGQRAPDRRDLTPQLLTEAQPIIHLNYPPHPMLDVTTPPLSAPPPRQLTETIAQLPRELSGPEVHALWNAASADARIVIAALLGGLSIEELAGLRYENIDYSVLTGFDAKCV